MKICLQIKREYQKTVILPHTKRNDKKMTSCKFFHMNKELLNSYNENYSPGISRSLNHRKLCLQKRNRFQKIVILLPRKINVNKMTFTYSCNIKIKKQFPIHDAILATLSAKV